jgi:GH24 family phage-related lysozyme (muramidase)
VTPEPTTETIPETTTTAETTTTTTTTTTTKAITTTTKELAAPVQQAASEDNGVRVYDVSMGICKFISQYEGNYALYQCESDCWTVGYGHAFTSKESRSWSREKAMSMMNRDIEKVLGKEYCLTAKNQKLSDEAAMKLLQWDLTNGYKPQLDRFIKKNQIKMNQQQYDACISFAYNCGANVWSVKRFKFRDTLVSYKDCSKIPAHIARDQLDNWNHGAHGVLKGLTRRRRNEARLFSTGSYKIINSPDDYCV